MINKIKNLIRNKLISFLFIDLNTKEIATCQNQIKEFNKILRDRTEYHLDIHHHVPYNSQVILIGKYHKMDFVKCYNIPDESFQDIIDHCRKLELTAKHNKIDAWPAVSACIKNKLGFLG